MDQEKIGGFIKTLRNEKEMTQAELAEVFHVSNKAISRWETGKNMPDISILIELAEFFGVDISEILAGEKKGITSHASEEHQNEERTKNVTENDVIHQVADYANQDKSSLLKWIRRASIAGVILMLIALILSTVCLEARLHVFLIDICLLVSFIIMLIIALYTNGRLEKLLQNDRAVKGIKLFLTVAGVFAIFTLLRSILIVGAIIALEAWGSETRHFSGIDDYNKDAILTEYRGDLDSGLLIFPDEINAVQEPFYEAEFRTGLFDTDGYMVMELTYEAADYEAEVKRISEISVTLSDRRESITQGVRLDLDDYAFPAYVASDGYDDVYEYALLDEEELRIIYVYLSYPQSQDLSGYRDYLKQEFEAYENPGNTLTDFSIYGYSFDGGKSAIEYRD